MVLETPTGGNAPATTQDGYQTRLTMWINMIISEAIRADMERNGFMSVAKQDPNCDPGDGAVYEFTRVPYIIDGRDTIPSWQEGDVGTITLRLAPGWVAGDEDDEVYEFDPYLKVYWPWMDAVREVFRPWMELPDPDAFSPQLKRLDTALTQLCPGISAGGNKTQGGSAKNIKGFKGVGPVPDTMGDIQDELSSMLSGDSAAVDTFYNNYVNDYLGVNSAQFEVVFHLKLAVAAQQELWTRTRKDVLTVAAAGYDAMRGAGKEESDSGIPGVVFTVVGTLAAAASLVVTDGAAATVISEISTGTGLLSQFWPKGDKDATEDVPSLGDADPGQVLENIFNALNSLDSKIYDIESGSYSSLSDVEGKVGAKNSPFRLRSPQIIRETDPSGNNLVQRNLLRIYPHKLHGVGMEMMPKVAAHVKTAAHHLTVGSGPWYRAHHGMVDTGPWPMYNALAETLQNILVATAGDLVAAGETLDDIGKLLHDYDSDVAAMLTAHKKDFLHHRHVWSQHHDFGAHLPKAPSREQPPDLPDVGDTDPTDEGHPDD